MAKGQGGAPRCFLEYDGSYKIRAAIGNNNRWDYTTTTSISLSTWTKVTWILDGSTGQGRIMFDDAVVLDQTTSNWDDPTNNAAFAIGMAQRSDTFAWDNGFSGDMDEAYIIKGAKVSVDRIKAEYRNESSPSTFASAGTPETPGAPTSLIPVILNQYVRRNVT